MTGPVAAGKMFSAARANGIAEKTLKRAKKSVGVEVSKSGFSGGWEWSISLSHEGGHEVGPLRLVTDVDPLRETDVAEPISDPIRSPRTRRGPTI